MLLHPRHRLLSSLLTRICYSSANTIHITRQPKRVLTDDGKDYNEVELGLPPDPTKKLREVFVKKNKNRSFQTKKTNPRIIRTKTNYKFIDAVISITSKSRKKNRNDLVLLEGLRLILDSKAAGAKFETIYYSDEHKLEEFPEIIEVGGEEIPIVKVSEEDYNLVSKQVTPSGFMAICSKPSDEQLEKIREESKQSLLPLTVIAESFSDPGNLGALVRSSAAVGASKLICSERCVHVWDPKVLRSGSGSHFRLPIVHSVDWETIHSQLLSQNSRLFYAESSTEEPSVYDVNFLSQTENFPLALLVGSETRGFQPEAKELIEKMNGQRLSIPLTRGVESLNNHVAAAVIMYEMKRQLLKCQIE